ncbi:MAG: hypothetical protein GQF41_0399 [Candidatus Rifleibacterium amylolyticum]|nr:MAG: hypothetical protein GQF41_0399 [Candidatus Rifleibacterium amylolyticum]
MPLFGKRNLVMLLVIKIFVIGLFLSGCQEGTNKSPVSTLLTGLDMTQATVDLTTLGEDVAKHNIVGTVVSQNTGEKLANITVSLIYENQLAATTKTTSDGQFYFAKVPAGLFDLAFASPDNTYASTTYIIRVLEDGTTAPADPEVKMIALNPAQIKVQAKIEGEVILTGTGEKLANINVELKLGDTLISTTLTGTQGQFSFTNLGEGSYKIDTSGSSNYTTDTKIVEVRNDGVVSPRYTIISLAAKAIEKASISGLVKSTSNDSVTNLKVNLCNDPAGSSITAHTRTTGEGKFFFEDLDVSKMYYIQVEMETTKSDVFPVVIRPDGTTSPAVVEVLLPLKEASDIVVKGQVFDAFTGGAIEYASIKLGEDSNAVTTVSDKNGLFTISNLAAPANYKLIISKFGYDTVTSGFQIDVDKKQTPASLTFPLLHSMRSDYGSFAGRYVDLVTGSGLANTYIHLFKWVQRTQNFTVILRNSDGSTRHEVRQVTDWEVLPDAVLTTKTSNLAEAVIPNFIGAFKMTHLEPGYYVAHFSDQATPPSYFLQPRVAYYDLSDGSEITVNWKEIAPDLLPKSYPQLTGLKIESGKTTYWTNYEQADRQVDGW